MPEKGVLFMYNSLIRGDSSAGLCDEAIVLYVHMVLQGVLLDKFTFPLALSAYSKTLAFCEGVQLHGSLVKMGFEQDVFIGNPLIHFYAECGDLDYAHKGAVSLFLEMVAAGVKPNSVTMVCVISACAKFKDVALSETVCAYIGESGLKTNMLMVNSLVDMYMKCGATDAAKRLFDECVDKNLVLYNTILSNYVRQGLASEAVSAMGQMLQQGLRPDKVNMLAAISACAQPSDSLSDGMRMTQWRAT
ncbi:putative pentatricopeptide [Rosa chinensis]|uniref:Putative pentatricopeptide n=1 Tax=Rosa chinensis TaxID=74649 RepID=A0A2P6RE73_ROSCH|nr:putative pentatricopeptide [Rosa chinensis]